MEDRDHVLLSCEKWEEERRVIWDEWRRKGKKGEVVDMKWLLFEEDGIEAVKKFGRATGWIDVRWKEKREWDNERKEEWGKIWVEGRKNGVEQIEKDRRDRRLRVDRERARRNRAIKKGKGIEDGGRGREGTPIASVPPLGAYPGRRRKVLGELKDGGNRRKLGMD